MDVGNTFMLQPKTLAWIEHKGDQAVLPVVWFGCLHGYPARLVVGLRSEACLVGEAHPLQRFCLCWLQDRSPLEKPLEKGQHHEQIVRLNCRAGLVVHAHGTLTLHGKMERLTIGQRTFAAGQVDFARLLGSSSRADA